MRWLLRNLPSLLLSLMLAIVVWYIAVERENPLVDQQFKSVPLYVLDQPPGTTIVTPIPQTINVTLRGPQNVLQAMPPSDIQASIDLGSVGRGVTRVPVHTAVSGRAIRIQAVEPSTVTLEIEDFRTIQLPIHLAVEGEPARGFIKGSPRLSATHISIQGPAPDVDRVKEITGTIRITDARADVTQSVTVVPMDSASHLVSNVVISPTLITATIPIQQRDDFADLPVRVRWQGQPASGYRIANISVEPKSVLVTGAPQVIASLPGFVETNPVDVEGAKGDVIRRVDLIPPNGTLPTQESSVLVEVKIEPIESGAAITLPVEFQNLDRSLWAIPSPETVDVLLFGPISDLQALKAGDVHVYLDVGNLHNPGVYTVAPHGIALSSNITVTNVLPATIQVVIGTGPTPTPAPPPTATVSPRG